SPPLPRISRDRARRGEVAGPRAGLSPPSPFAAESAAAAHRRRGTGPPRRPLNQRRRPAAAELQRGAVGKRGKLLDFHEDVALADARTLLGRQAGDGAGLVGLDRVLHLHGLEHDDGVALGDLGALLDGDLDDGALHRGDHGVTGGGLLGATGTLLLGLLAGATGDATQGQVARQGNLDAAAVNLDDDLLGRNLLVLVGGLGVIDVGRDRVVPLLLDPLGVDIELLAVADERRVLDDVGVERDDRGHALDLVLRQGAGRTAQRLLAG